MRQFFKEILLLTTTTLLLGFGYAQTSNWVVLSNGIGQPTDIDVDENGNVYTLGNESAEMEFRSVKSTGPTHHSNVPWRGQYLTKHTSEGNLDFVLHFSGIGSNQNTTGSRDILILQDNRLAVSIWCSNKFNVVDSQGDSTEVQGRGSFLILFDEKGQYQEAISLPIGNVIWVSQTSDGNVYVLGRKKSYMNSNNCAIAQVNLGSNEAILVNDALSKKMVDFMIIGNTLWFMEMEVTCSEYYYQCKTYNLYSLSSGSTTPNLIESYEFGLCRSNEAELIESDGKPIIVFRVEVGRGKGIPLNSYTIPYVKDYTSWLFMNSNGELLKTLNIDGISKHQAISSLDDGGYLIRHIVYDTLQIEGEKPITVPHHKSFIYELCYTKLNSNYQLESIVLGGGISDSGSSPFLVKGNILYNSALLHQDCIINGVEQKLTWSHGHFVRKHRLGTKP